MFPCSIKENGLPRRCAPRNDRAFLTGGVCFYIVHYYRKGDGTETVPYDIALLCGKPCSIPKLFVDKDYVQFIEKTGLLLDYRRDGADALCVMAVHTFAGDGAGRVEAEPLRVL